MQFDVITSISPQGIIATVTEAVRDGIRATISSQIVNTQDQQIREALIKLGWTPPDVARTVSSWQPAGTGSHGRLMV